VRWEDERYVRIYTRDTVDWLALGWEAQALFCLMLRKVDRAGLVDLGKGGTRGLAALLQMPLDVVDRALAILLEDSCVVRVGTKLLVRNFIEAQETPTSTAQRKRDQRERDRDTARASGFVGSDNGADVVSETNRKPAESGATVSRTVTPEVTRGHERSQNVTNTPGDGHAESRAVTPNRAVPSVPSRTEPAVKAESAPPTKAPDNPLADPASFFAQVQLERAAGGLPRETPPRPEALSRWWSEMLMELNGDTSLIPKLYRGFAGDPFWRAKQPPLPFPGFMSQWRKYVPARAA
jgi:hypothetical protein